MCHVWCPVTSLKILISWEKGRSVFVLPITDYHIEDSGADYGTGNLAFLLKKSKKFEQNKRKNHTKNKVLPT